VGEFCADFLRMSTPLRLEDVVRVATNGGFLRVGFWIAAASFAVSLVGLSLGFSGIRILVVL
jgi:hypothetical protein